jgi:hypothetical protein
MYMPHLSRRMGKQHQSIRSSIADIGSATKSIFFAPFGGRNTSEVPKLSWFRDDQQFIDRPRGELFSTR